jgi:hypothetical protein
VVGAALSLAVDAVVEAKYPKDIGVELVGVVEGQHFFELDYVCLDGGV